MSLHSRDLKQQLQRTLLGHYEFGKASYVFVDNHVDPGRVPRTTLHELVHKDDTHNTLYGALIAKTFAFPRDEALSALCESLIDSAWFVFEGAATTAEIIDDLPSLDEAKRRASALPSEYQAAHAAFTSALRQTLPAELAPDPTLLLRLYRAALSELILDYGFYRWDAPSGTIEELAHRLLRQTPNNTLLDMAEAAIFEAVDVPGLEQILARYEGPALMLALRASIRDIKSKLLAQLPGLARRTSLSDAERVEVLRRLRWTVDAPETVFEIGANADGGISETHYSLVFTPDRASAIVADRATAEVDAIISHIKQTNAPDRVWLIAVWGAAREGVYDIDLMGFQFSEGMARAAEPKILECQSDLAGLSRLDLLQETCALVWLASGAYRLGHDALLDFIHATARAPAFVIWTSFDVSRFRAALSQTLPAQQLSACAIQASDRIDLAAIGGERLKFVAPCLTDDWKPLAKSLAAKPLDLSEVDVLTQLALRQILVMLPG